jgi:hypothetical protein
MRAFPAVIATQGCFAWRNAAPLALSNREMLGVGNDEAPVRLIVLQLLYLLNRRLHVTTDGYGLKPNLSAYLGQFKPPTFELGIGDVDALVKLRLPAEQKSTAQQSKRIQPARDHALAAGAKPAHKPADKPAAKTAASEMDKAATSSGVFDKPAPFASAPAPAAETPKSSAAEMEKAATSSGVFDKPSPFASAPAPAAETPKSSAADVVKPFRPAVAPLGSAPIPGFGSATGNTEAPAMSGLDSMPLPDLDDDEPEAPAAAAPTPPSRPIPSVVPPKPAVDIELTGDIEVSADAKSDDNQADSMPDFESTMIIAPDASLSNKPSTSSSDAFIDRVKKQLADSDSAADKDEAFIQTTRL